MKGIYVIGFRTGLWTIVFSADVLALLACTGKGGSGTSGAGTGAPAGRRRQEQRRRPGAHGLAVPGKSAYVFAKSRSL